MLHGASVSQPLVPPWLLVTGIATVAGAGALANCTLLLALFKHSRTGLYSIVMQLAAADLVLIGAGAVPEIWSYNGRHWCFGAIGCVVHRGLRAFAAAATLYLTITLALHALVNANLEQRAAIRHTKRIDADDELGSSQHSLVASSNSATPPRTMKVTYRTATSVSTTLPSVFIWILAVSLSVPEFVIALNKNTFREEIETCFGVNVHRLNMYSVLVMLDLFMPSIILLIVCTFIIVKLCSKRRALWTGCAESVDSMKLSLWLASVFVLLCAPGDLFSVYRTYLDENTIGVTELALSGMRLIGSLARPLLSFALLPSLRRIFSNTKDVDPDSV